MTSAVFVLKYYIQKMALSGTKIGTLTLLLGSKCYIKSIIFTLFNHWNEHYILKPDCILCNKSFHCSKSMHYFSFNRPRKSSFHFSSVPRPREGKTVLMSLFHSWLQKTPPLPPPNILQMAYVWEKKKISHGYSYLDWIYFVYSWSIVVWISSESNFQLRQKLIHTSQKSLRTVKKIGNNYYIFRQ